jgi:DNA replication protein DnaC
MWTWWVSRSSSEQVNLSDPTYADAILDRLVHNAYRLDLAGESLRRRRSRAIPKD